MLLSTTLAGCGDGTTGPSTRPELLNRPPTTVDYNDPWSYRPTWTNPNGDTVAFRVDQKPSWVAYDSVAVHLSGTAGWDQIGVHRLTLTLDDGSGPVARAFDITVQKGEIHCDEGWPSSLAEAEYILPYREGASYNVSQTYCNASNSHNLLHAYDLDTAIGDTLLASRGGVVLTVRERFADNNATAGEENWVWIEHDDGTVMNYVHIAEAGALVAVGDTVQQGQAIALSGNSGLTHRPHVHTALYRSKLDFSRQASIPIAYRNAIGNVDANGGLRVGRQYEAGPPGS